MHATTMTPTATTDEFDYTAFVLRTDATYEPLDLAMYTMQPPVPFGVHEGNTSDLMACVVGIWTQFDIPAPAVAAMTGVLHGLLTKLEGGVTFYEADPDEFVEFVTTNPDPANGPTGDQMRLRRNVIHGAYLALEDAGVVETPTLLDIPQLIEDGRSDRRGKHRQEAMEQRTRNTYDKRVHVRPATHDEVLLTRLATRLVGTNRAKHLAAAAVAGCSATATTSEAPQILWANRAGNQLQLPGRTAANGITETDIAARTVTLDTWSTGVLDAWHGERTAHRPVDPEASMLYSGNQSLTSNSAAICIDKQVRNAMDRAGLTNTRGLTAGSLRLWAATRDVTDVSSGRAAARRAGIRYATLHRLIHKLGERGL